MIDNPMKGLFLILLRTRVIYSLCASLLLAFIPHYGTAKSGEPESTNFSSALAKFDEFSPLDPQGYRAMMNLHLSPGERARASAADVEKEKHRGLSLCASLLGLSQEKVFALIGSPSKLSDKNLFDFQESSTYFFGWTPLVIRVYFTDGKCNNTTCTPFYEDRQYCVWRASTLEKQAIGKSRESILSVEGRPGDQRTDGVTEIWRYQFCDGIGCQLTFTNGICTAAQKDRGIMIGFGAKPSERESHVATFRLPD